MSNQQLIEHCREILAETENHEQWAVDMARAALASLESKPVAHAHRLVNKFSGVAHPWCYGSGERKPSEGDIFSVEVIPLFIAPPVPELKFPEEKFCPAEYAGSLLWSESEQWNKCIEEVKRLNGVKS